MLLVLVFAAMGAGVAWAVGTLNGFVDDDGAGISITGNDAATTVAFNGGLDLDTTTNTAFYRHRRWLDRDRLGLDQHHLHHHRN